MYQARIPEIPSPEKFPLLNPHNFFTWPVLFLSLFWMASMPVFADSGENRAQELAYADESDSAANKADIDRALEKEKQGLRRVSKDRQESQAESQNEQAKRGEAEEEEEGHSLFVATLLYLPNRVLDIFDILRLRVRVGPGVAAGFRVTEYVQLYLGSYASLYGGLPGPRRRTLPRSPIGLETYNGVVLSVLDATVDGGFGPDYSPSEVGVGVQAAIAGIDVGLDPVEIVDFFAGIFGADIREDDY